MQKHLLLYIIFLTSYTTIAQPYISVRGDFSIDQRRGCRDMFLTVTNITPGTDVILYQFEGKTSAVTTSTTHNYTLTGKYWLYQYIQGASGQKVDSIEVEILDPIIPTFELQSCNNNDVQLKIMNTDYDYYDVDYGDGTNIQVPVNTFTPIHNYPVSGNYVVSVTGRYSTANNSCGVNTTNFTPVAQVQPAQFNFIHSLNDTDLVIDYTLAPNTISTLQISLNSTSGFQKFKDLNQDTSRDTLRGLQLGSNVYCFRVASNDACSNFSAFSTELCSIGLETLPVNDVNELTWATLYSGNNISLEIYRDGVLLENLTNQTFAYNDSSVVCNTTYCYQLIANNLDGSQVISPEICTKAISTTPPSTVTNVSTSISNSELVWDWQVPEDEIVSKFRLREADGSFIADTDQNQYRTSTEQTQCLNFEFTNSCDNASLISPSYCPLIIDYAQNSDGSVLISWSAYNGWQNGVQEYIVVVYDHEMNIVDSVSVGFDTEFTDPLPSNDNQVSRYRVYALPTQSGIMMSSSNTITLERPPIISVPNSFTPNGDNLNDELVVSGKYIKSFQLNIINRWGTVIFSTTDNSWNGTVDGKKVTAGTYVFMITVKDFVNKEHIRSGTVLILKD